MLTSTHMTGTDVPFRYCSAPHGKAVGERVGEVVGEEVVGESDGKTVGDGVGEIEGETVGDRDGDCVGSEVVGERVGDLVKVGDDDGNHVLPGVQLKRTTPAWYWDGSQAQFSNAHSPMLTESGMVMLARLAHP